MGACRFWSKFELKLITTPGSSVFLKSTLFSWWFEIIEMYKIWCIGLFNSSEKIHNWTSPPCLTPAYLISSDQLQYFWNYVFHDLLDPSETFWNILPKISSKFHFSPINKLEICNKQNSSCIVSSGLMFGFFVECYKLL